MPRVEPRITLVTLGVEDLPRAVTFYRDVVGWTPASDQDGVAFFDLGGFILALWPFTDLAADIGIAVDGRATSDGVALAHNARSREDVDAIFGQLEERGARIVKPPVETEWGGYSGYFADPDGHHWEVAFNPSWPIREDGRIAFPKK